MKKLKLWWKWRKVKREDFPLRYVGTTLTVRGSTIEYGTPLRIEAGPRGARTGQRFLAPDGIIRLLPRDLIEVR